MTRVRLESLSKRFGDAVALDGVDLDIASGELFFLLGPSGCGKTTLLRLIAGLHEPSGGQIWFDERDVTRVSVEKRNAVMCFQGYALWPHLSVRENVAFGPRVRREPTGLRERRVAEALELVQMDSFAGRKPGELSGGQQQRVALARALAVAPACLLLDEPLSNLDARLRVQMRSEIRRICKANGFTAIYVTHDQNEALSAADRIAVLRAGKIAQVGTPAQLYRRPATGFVADFIAATNLLPGAVAGPAGAGWVVETSVGKLIGVTADDTPPPPAPVIVSVRPQQMRLIDPHAPARPEMNRLTGRTTASTLLGDGSEHTLEVRGSAVKVFCVPPIFDPPAEMTVEFAPADTLILSE